MTPKKDTLFVTHCSAQKNGPGGPLTLYASSRIQRFGNWCNDAGVRWAIVSAKYGLFLPDECHERYDTTFTSFYGDCVVIEDGEWLPDDESRAHVDRLVEGIGSRLRALGIRRVVFYLGGAFERVSPCYFLVIHRPLDDCTQPHGSRQALRECIAKAGRLYMAGGMFDLEGEATNLGRVGP